MLMREGINKKEAVLYFVSFISELSLGLEDQLESF